MESVEEPQRPELRWSEQYRLVHGTQEGRLQGDKIVLPPSALEQLISASTTASFQNASTNGSSDAYNTSAFPFPHTQSADHLHDLPHPLMFRLVNPQNGNVAYCGVREFSADEGTVQVSTYLQNALGLAIAGSLADSDHEMLTVHARNLPKGTSVRFRPLEAGYDPEDWKSLLEKHMRTMFTTLTKGQVLTVPSGKVLYQFLVDKVTPDGDGICVIDTDLEVDIEPIDEAQALESLKKWQAKAQQTAGNSAGGKLTLNKPLEGRVGPDSYVDYFVETWEKDKPLQINVSSQGVEAVDVFVTPYGARQRARPRVDRHLFEDVSDRLSKTMRIAPSNVAVQEAEQVFVSVSCFPSAHALQSGKEAVNYTIEVKSVQDAQEAKAKQKHEEMSVYTDQEPDSVDPGDLKCKNCNQWVSESRLFLHENFCFRNNVRCPKCEQVFQRSSDEWKGHWHCDFDAASGSSSEARQKHDKLYHVPCTCEICGEGMSDNMGLAKHRVTICPGKEILCQFCHLLVPQKGPEDPEFTDPEVMLSGLTPHELTDGARTTDCHMCGKIVRFRDMSTHLKYHDLERLSRPTPRMCRNVNCGRTLDGVGLNGQIRPIQPSRNDLMLCDTCFGPLYNSVHDPEHKALKRRAERKYLTQLVTGCGQGFCRNEFCKNGRFAIGLMEPGQAIRAKEALIMTRPELDNLLKLETSLHLCTDESSQKKRTLAEMIAAESDDDAGGTSYNLPWSIAALEAENGDLSNARNWLANWAPTRQEEQA